MTVPVVVFRPKAARISGSRSRRIRQTLTMPFYAGLASIHGEIVGPAQWPAYITPDAFGRLRSARATRARLKGPRSEGRPPEGYVLARLAACGTCGSAMDVVTGRYIRKDGTRARRYVCRIHRERPQDCDAPPISAELVDPAFVANLGSFLVDVSGWRDRLTTSLERDNGRLAADRDSAATELAESERVQARMRDRYGAALAEGDDARAEAIDPPWSRRA